MLRKILPVFITASLLLVMYGGSQEILESPVGIQTVPLGSNATFSCRTTGLLVWRVGSAQILHPSQISNLAKQKIYITGDSVPDENSGLEHSSTVIITGTRDNNVTMLWCLVTFDLLQYNESDPGILYTFDHPEAPSKVQVVPVGPFQLNLSWNAPFALPGVDITFIVQAKDLNSGNISSSDKVESEYYIFEGSRPCDEYLFSVIAVNDAGSSGISREISGSLPALPDISRISESLHHSVHIKEDRVGIEITFMAAQSCEGYPVQSYYLVVHSRDIEAEVLGPFVPTEGPTVVITLNSTHGINIQENTQYFIKIIASNVIGNTTSRETDCLTTDVQYTKLSLAGHFVNISCQFAPGSKALGCQVDLVPRHSNESIISHRIEKTGNNASEVIMTAFPSSCYDIIVYDWESDNTTGDVVVPLDMYWSDSEHRESCLPTTEDPLRPNTGSGTNIPLQTIVIAGGVGGGVIVIALFICVILLVICLVKKARGRRTKQKISWQVTTNWNDYPSKSLSPPIITLRSDSQTTQMTVVELHEPPMPPVYDAIQNYRPRQESVTASEMEYNTLNRSNQLSPLQLNGAAQHNPDYAHLNQDPIYHVLECSSNPSPVEVQLPVQPEYSEIADLQASSPPPPQSRPPPPQSRPPPPQSKPPPPQSKPPPPQSKPPPPQSRPPLPQSRPPPPQSKPPPPQSKPPPLPLPEAWGNDYSKVPSAGTTIY